MEQLSRSWFSADKKDSLFFIGDKIDDIDKDFLSIKPVSEITRTRRSIGDKKDWKGL